ncbi:hypothetical protein DID88_004108 [Monilinia fructigena]|uniref:Nucleolar protein Dnt1-like N-terminal domain-containing protein n=1 Tax=Monilinia fructigena TaxID=38457 RepID=A0A395IRV5_9HELO|nr:hypothetical protein DID88_004108 [Monilinia fructigena]
MESPSSPGFSLRVKVFTPDAAEEKDRPIRCFRVITSPNITIREFCTEASRVHEINYGQPLAIKKCMDDELFDVTQNDLLGPLFPNMSTIRIIKAPNKPNIRDSLPPTSALRFNPISVLGQKRDRSPLNGNVEPFWNPQKRQRTAIDPDHPIPSRELESWAGGRLEGIPEKPETIIPDSQQSVVLGHEDEDEDRDNDTVPNFSASNTNAQSNRSPRELVNPFQEPPPRIQGAPQSSAGVKRASYHIQKATDGGRSVSTSATSPMAGETQLPQSHSKSTKKQNPLEKILPGAKSSTPKNRSPRTAVSIYDDFGTDTEEPTHQQSKLGPKKSPAAGLPDSQKLAVSPLNSNRSASKAFQSISTPKELPLTPKSRRREEEIRKNKESQEASKEARAAAAKAADERRQERKAEEKQKQATKKQKEEAALGAQRLKDEKDKLRKEIEEEDKRKAAEEESKKAEALESSKRASDTPQGSNKGTPVNKRNTPGVILPRQSSTPHYPRGKKSSLKKSRSLENALPPKSPRRVSFDLNEAITPAKSLSKRTLVETPKESTTPLASSQAPAQSQTPIPLPKTFRRPDRSATPIKQPPKPSAMNQPPMVAARGGSKARSATPKPIPPPSLQKISTEPKILPKKTVTPEPRKTVTSTPDRSIPAKEKTNSSVKPAEIPLPPSSDDSDSKEELTIKPEPKKSTSPQNLRAELNNNAQFDEDVEMGENQSSPRESRSPVVFHSNGPSGDEQIKETQESSEDDSDNDDEERKDEDVEMPDAPAQRFSPELPSHTRRNLISPSKTTNQLQGPSFSSPAKKPTIKPPTFSFGASLSSLNSQKGAMFKPKPLTNGQFAKSKSQLSSQMFNKEFSESESEEDSDSDDSSDDDDVPIPASSQIIPPSGQGNRLMAQTAKNNKDTGSDSDSDSDSSSDDAAAMEQARRSLIAQVYQNGMSASQNSLPQSSQISVNGGAGTGKGKVWCLARQMEIQKVQEVLGKNLLRRGRIELRMGMILKVMDLSIKGIS